MIRWQELNDTTSPLWRSVFALYDDTFPPEVREPHDVLLRSVAKRQEIAPNAFHFLLALDEQDRVASFATAHYLADVRFGFLVYLVVNPSLRSLGLGAEMLTRMEDLLRQDGPLHGMILETEREEDAHSMEEAEACRNRHRFFARQGFIRMEQPYLQPPLTPEQTQEDAVPLHLHVKLYGNTVPIGSVIDEMYQHKYAEMNLISPALLAACKSQ